MVGEEGGEGGVLMSAETPRDFGRRKGRAFAEAVETGTFPGSEEFVSECLEGHRRAAEDESNRWCAAYSSGFLSGYAQNTARAAKGGRG